MKLFSIDIEAILPAVLTIPILPTACIFISDGNIASVSFASNFDGTSTPYVNKYKL